MVDLDFSEIDLAIAAESWEYLQDMAPALAAAVAKSVKRGASPKQIRRHVMMQTQRPALALRCEQAANFIAKDGDER
jgi:hypothetical protein